MKRISNIFKQIKESLEQKFGSRRWLAMWILTAILIVLFAIPPLTAFIVNAVAGTVLTFVLLSQESFTALLMWIWGSYLLSDYKTKQLGQYMEDTKKFSTPFAGKNKIIENLDKDSKDD